MSASSVRAACEMLFQQEWISAPATPRTPIKFEEVPFKQAAAQRYVALRVVITSGQQMSIGYPALERQRGFVAVEIFTEENVGARVADILADYAQRVFRRRQVKRNNTVLSFEMGYVLNPGPRLGYVQRNVIMPFDADELFYSPDNGLITFDSTVVTFDNDLVTF